MRLDRPLSWLEIILICLLAALTVFWLLPNSPLRGHHSQNWQWLEKIAQCESGGDWGAVNERTSEKHDQGQIGSYGKYQFGVPTWQETVKRAVLIGKADIGWIHVYPDAAPPEIQQQMATLIWDSGKGWRHWAGCAAQVGYPQVRDPA